MRFSSRPLFAIGLHRLVIGCSLRVSAIALFYKRLWLEVYLYNHERWRSDQWRQPLLQFPTRPALLAPLYYIFICSFVDPTRSVL